MSSNEEPFVSIDNLEDIFSQTVGSIKGAAGMVLWCWSIYSSMSLDFDRQSPLTYLAIAWFTVVVLTRLAMALNVSMVSGFQSWTLDPKSDVILITGGSSGLGLVLMAMFSSNGFRIVNFDLHPPPIDIANSSFHKCNVADSEMVHETIVQLVDSGIKPTVLINCAGTVAGSLGPARKISTQVLRSVIDTNLLGAMQTTTEILRASPEVKMVVGISSSTALVGPAYSAVYAASKAGVRTYFESLRHEYRGSRQTRVLLVTPGQLDTAMFKDVKTPSKFWAPTMKAVDVAASIHNAVISGRQGELAMPVYSRLLPYIQCLPLSWVDLLRTYIGVDSAAASLEILNE